MYANLAHGGLVSNFAPRKEAFDPGRWFFADSVTCPSLQTSRDLSLLTTRNRQPVTSRIGQKGITPIACRCLGSRL